MMRSSSDSTIRNPTFCVARRSANRLKLNVDLDGRASSIHVCAPQSREDASFGIEERK
jgi:hypothetical protein